MMIKEKVIFLPLLAIFTGILLFGFSSKGKREVATEELLQDIELAIKKSKAKAKDFKDKWDLDKIEAADSVDRYGPISKRSPFFREASKKIVKKVEPILVKEEPKEPLFSYKGRVTMGAKVMVIIEDHGTGKSFFAQEGDMVGDFLVSRVEEKEVVLRKEGEEEIVLKAVKKEETKTKSDVLDK